MKKLVLTAAFALAGLLAAVLIAAPAAKAYNLGELSGLGYTLTVSADLGQSSCSNYYATGNGAPSTLLGSTDPVCTDPNVLQQRIDALVAAYPPPPPTAAAPPTTDAAPPGGGSSPPPTATAPPALPTPPVADFAVTPGGNSYVLDFDDTSTSSTAINARVWQFGDGAAATEVAPSHVYIGPGTYQVVLIVIDSSGLTSLAVRSVTINADKTVSVGPRTTALVMKPTTIVKKPVAKHQAKKKPKAKKKATRKP